MLQEDAAVSVKGRVTYAGDVDVNRKYSFFMYFLSIMQYIIILKYNLLFYLSLSMFLYEGMYEFVWRFLAACHPESCVFVDQPTKSLNLDHDCSCILWHADRFDLNMTISHGEDFNSFVVPSGLKFYRELSCQILCQIDWRSCFPMLRICWWL